jgi:hypothetical protein
MNAYELADEFDWMTEEKIVQWCNDVVNMLRQQADRIAELEKTIQDGIQAFGKVQDQMLDNKFAFPRWSKEKEMFDSWVSHEKQSVEPVAWIKKDTLIFLGNYEFGSITIQVQKQKDDEFDIPLYTTPQIKELSDEEIEKLQAEHTEKGHFADTLNVKDFARAILKKASEK